MHTDVASPEVVSDRDEAPGQRAPARGAWRRSLDLKVLLLLLPLGVAVPLLVYAGFLLEVMAEQAADHARREQAATHSALQAAVVAQLGHVQQTLGILAESPALSGEAVDVERTRSLAERLVRAGLGAHTLAVLDPGGKVVAEFPARGPPGRVVTLAPQQRRAFETGQAVLSDLHQSPLGGPPSPSVEVPVRREGRVAWLITALLDPAQLSRTLSAQVGEREALSTVLDARRRIVARTRELDRFYGESPSAETLQALDSGPQGWRRFRTRDGNVFLWTWSRTPAGWTVFLGSPAREFDDTLRRSMVRLAGVGLAVLAVAMAATALLARRIGTSVNRMAEDAGRLAGGERPPKRRSGIRQLDALYAALEQAHDEVRRAMAERKRALDAERAARALADEHNRSKDLFLGMLSHELRNPLAPIRNSVHILKRADPASEQARRARAVIDRQTEHLARIVDDLLDVTRIARGKILLRRARVDLRDEVHRAVEDARAGIEQRGVGLRLELPGERVWAEADATRVAQILGNLLHNASKFSRAGDEISVALRPVEGAAELRVRDTGAGIDPELLPHLFDPFVQGARTLARSEGGLGLGLALVRGLAELHGGSVRAQSAGVGQGAEFVVTLPVLEQADARASPACLTSP